MLKAIFFDLDETLLAFDDDAYEKLITEVCDKLCSLHTEIDPRRLEAAYKPINAARWNSALEGTGTAAVEQRDGFSVWREVWRQALVACEYDNSTVLDDVTELYVTTRRASYQLYGDVTATLELLAAQYKLAVITNGPVDSQVDKLQVTSLHRYFDLVVTSGELGIAKPNPAIFHHALSTLAIEPPDAWHVGDSLQSDIAGALNASLGAGIWLNRNGRVRDEDHPVPHHEITSLGELPGLLDSG